MAQLPLRDGCWSAIACSLAIALASSARAQTPSPASADLPAQALALSDLSAFRAPSPGWKIVGAASTPGETSTSIVTTPGVGTVVHVPSSGTSALATTWNHGDIDLSFDLMSTRGSTARVLLMGRYPVALSDSWVRGAPTPSTIGAISSGWNDNSGLETIKLGPVQGPGPVKPIEGAPPRQNAGRAPGLWQHVDVSFRAPRYAGTRMLAHARFVNVTVNGVVVQDNVQIDLPTTGIVVSEAGVGPLTFEGAGAFAIRNIQYKSYANTVALSGLRYRVYEGEAMDASYASSHAPTREGSAASISPDLQAPQDKFAVAYEGTLTAPTAGRYRFGLALGWIGNDSTTRGASIGGGTLSVDGKPVVNHTGAERRSVGDVDLAPGAHAIAVSYYKNRPQFNRRDISITVEGPGVERRSLSEAAVPGGGNAPIDPIMVEPQAEPVVLRSFMRHRNTKRVYVASVADPLGVHYSYDVAQGSLLYAWRGPFLETTQMWHERGEDQTAEPMGSTLTLPGVPSIAYLPHANPAWPDSVGESAWPDSVDEKQLRREGYALDKSGHPTFTYRVAGAVVQDAIRPSADGLGLRRELRIIQTTLFAMPGPTLFVQVARADRLARQRDGSYVAGDRSYYVNLLASGATPILRHVNGMDELIVPVRFKKGKAAVSYTIAW